MKKLKKLQINHAKLMKNEELLILRGGYGDGKCCLYECTSSSQCCTDCPNRDIDPNWADGKKYCQNP